MGRPGFPGATRPRGFLTSTWISNPVSLVYAYLQDPNAGHRQSTGLAHWREFVRVSLIVTSARLGFLGSKMLPIQA